MLSNIGYEISAVNIVTNHITYERMVGIYTKDSWGISYLTTYNIRDLYYERNKYYA